MNKDELDEALKTLAVYEELELFLKKHPEMIKYQLQLTDLLDDMGSGERLMFINNLMLHGLRDLQVELNIQLERLR